MRAAGEANEEKASTAYSTVVEMTDVESQASQQQPLRMRLPAIALGSVGLAAGAAWLCSSARRQSGHSMQRGHAMQEAGVVTLGDRPWKMGDPNWWNTKCPGDLKIDGLGMKRFVNAYYNMPHQQAGGSYADGDWQSAIEVSQAGRGYLAESCEPQELDGVDPGWNAYDDVQYSKIKLLGQKLSYTMDFNGVGCGWDASLSLNAMAGNKDRGGCHDYFCDSMRTCGVACEEVSLQEANMHAWFSTLHTKNDGKGVGVGYGGANGEAPRRDWDSSQYGPKSECIDTETPFRVIISFPVDGKGQLKSMDVELLSFSTNCTVSASIDEYPTRGGVKSMEEISKAMENGMTLTFALWGSPGQSWLDGQGSDGNGPCAPGDDKPAVDVLADQDRVKWLNFVIEPLETAKKPKKKSDSSSQAAK